MAGTYYDIGVATPIANIAAALTAKYGAYNDPANLNGYREHDNSAEYLLFECAAIAGNRFIRLRWTSTTLQHQWGTARSGANTLTNPIDFGGTYTSTSAMTAIHLVLHDDAYFICTDGGNNTGARFALIGKLSNGEFGVWGASYSSNGLASALRHVGLRADNITNTIRCDLMLFSSPMLSAADKLITQPIVMIDNSNRRIMLDGAIPITFNNVVNVAFNGAVSTPIKAANFLMSGGQLVWLIDPELSSNIWMAHSAIMSEFEPEPE